MARNIDRLIDIMARLRDPQTGCPWDLEQTYRTIAPHTIEEAYEVADAIEKGDMAALREELAQRLGSAVPGTGADCAEVLAQVIAFIEQPGQGLELPLDLHGTVFQQRVWRALQQIPPGSLVTYAQIAERIGKQGSVRAVANACGANLLAVAIPCHRVVRSDGALSGYRWGVERKRALIERESQQAQGASVSS